MKKISQKRAATFERKHMLLREIDDKPTNARAVLYVGVYTGWPRTAQHFTATTLRCKKPMLSCFDKHRRYIEHLPGFDKLRLRKSGTAIITIRIGTMFNNRFGIDK